MGIAPHIKEVFGVKLTRKESKAFSLRLKEMRNSEFFMGFIEHLINEHKKYPKNFDFFSFIYKYIQREKDGSFCKDIKTIWTDETRQKFIEEFDDEIYEYHEQFPDDAPTGLYTGFKDTESMYTSLSYPVDYECNHIQMLGWSYTKELAYSDLAWTLAFHLHKECTDKIIEIKGKFPWQVGTEKYKKESWITYNGENFIPRNILKLENYSKEETNLIFGFFKGSKEEYEQKKKEMFERYAGDFWPYKTYNGDGWYGSQFKFKPIDELYKYSCKLVPELNYDKLRLGKFLTICWH